MQKQHSRKTNIVVKMHIMSLQCITSLGDKVITLQSPSQKATCCCASKTDYLKHLVFILQISHKSF